MTTIEPISFQRYEPGDYAACLALFGANSPEFFAPNEEADYREFLTASPDWYEVCIRTGDVIGAYGLEQIRPSTGAVRWILLHPTAHGAGIGSRVMNRLIERARASGLTTVLIAASQKSAPFFARFGAVVLEERANGWGPGLDRIDMILKLDR